MTIRLKVPPGLATTDTKVPRLKYHMVSWEVDGDGYVDVPDWAAEPLIEIGCEADGEVPKHRDALESAEDSSHHSVYMNAHGFNDHYFDYHTHYHSAQLREYAKTHDVKTQDGENLFEVAADWLDDLHQKHHKGGLGRIVMATPEQKKDFALELHDGMASGNKPRAAPWHPEPRKKPVTAMKEKADE